MLRWRLLFGTGLAIILIGLGWLDYLGDAAGAAVPGLWLLPVLALFGGFATRELLGMMATRGIRPVAWAVYGGVGLVLASPWGPSVYRWLAGQCDLGGSGGAAGAGVGPGDWVLLALAAALIVVFVAEMWRYREPGAVTANLAGAVLAIVYIGVLLSFAVRLRLAFGVGALASLVIVAKCGDSGAYFVGRLVGRHRMSPLLSPSKTVEGALGALIFSLGASWATFQWLVPAAGSHEMAAAHHPPCWAWIAFGLAIGGIGIVGDLAESLLKRDCGCKDSGRWLPGLGGVLDLLDSVLLGAPVALGFWALVV